MLRCLYVRLVRFHPTGFRERFGDDMLEIFDNTTSLSSILLLIWDCLVSLARQWVFRPDFRQPQPAVAASSVPLLSGRSADAPLFGAIDAYRPRPAALFYGSLLTVVTICAAIGGIASGARTSASVIGAHHPSQGLLSVDRGSVRETDLNTEVKFGPDPEDPLRPIASAYFRVVRVLYALDADHDLIISPLEMITAPAALRQLDADDDGKLTPEECGFFPGDSSGISDVAARARREFMRVNPVLAALDSDHDGEISASEIANSYWALRRLDRNDDRSLTLDELLPDREATQTAAIMARLDSNGDGVISRSEQNSEDALRLRKLLQSADRDHDGLVTSEDLRKELRLRAERKREFDQTRRAAGFR